MTRIADDFAAIAKAMEELKQQSAVNQLEPELAARILLQKLKLELVQRASKIPMPPPILPPPPRPNTPRVCKDCGTPLKAHHSLTFLFCPWCNASYPP